MRVFQIINVKWLFWCQHKCWYMFTSRKWYASIFSFGFVLLFFNVIDIVWKQGRIASHQAHCKGFQYKQTDIFRIVKVQKKLHFGSNQGISFSFNRYHVNSVTASTFHYRDCTCYHIFTLFIAILSMCLD